MSQAQNALSEALQRFLGERYTDEVRRGVARSEAGWSAEIWREFADLGVLGAFIGEESGGLGATAPEQMGVMEVLGHALVVEPFVSTAVIGGLLVSELRELAAARDLAQAIMSGGMRLALAHDERPFGFNALDLATSAERVPGGFRLTGGKIVVRDAPSATHLIVSAVNVETQELGLFLVPSGTDQVRLDPYRLIDGAPAADVRFSGAIVAKYSLLRAGKPAHELLGRLVDMATVAVCAEAIGLMRAMLEQTVTYARQRKQFGRRLADFQVLQHRLADMFVEIEQACSLVHRAFLARDDSEAVSAAKIRINQALRVVSHDTVQLHGAIGTTEEIELSQYFRRAAAIERQYGSSAEHYRRVERRVLRDIETVASAGVGVISEDRQRDDEHRYSIAF